MKATRFVEQQHRNAQELFDRIMSGVGDIARMLDELGKTMLTHMLIEQVVLFPEVLAPDGAEHTRAWDEHALERLELRRILYSEQQGSELAGTVSAFKDLVEHHIQLQEHDLLPKAESLLSPAVNERLGDQMEKIFDVLVARSHRSDCALACCRGLSGAGADLPSLRVPYIHGAHEAHGAVLRV